MPYSKHQQSRVLFSLVAAIIALSGFAQTRFNYQAVIRNVNDSVVPNHAVALRFTLHQDSEIGLPVFLEEHTGLTTSSIGLVTVLVGGGNVPGFGSLDSIDWVSHSFFLQVEANLFNGFDYMEMGTSPIVSVPIAEYAKNGGKPWRYDPNGIYYMEGNVGVGSNSAPLTALQVTGQVRIVGDTLDSERLHLTAINDSRDIHVGAYDELGVRHWNINMLDRSENDAFSIFSDDAQEHAFRITPSGGAEFRATTHSKIRLYATDASHDNYISAYNSAGDQKWIINMGTSDPNTNEAFAIYSNEANGGNGQYLMYLRPDGTTQVRCIEILGGCDINERFNSIQELEPGTVVIADPDRPGEVKTTNEAYDFRVLGVISGANGIKPGLTLSQENVLDGTHPVALSGRIYVKVVGAVKVGDLLTTSDEPGRAMAVTDRERAFGAVIGKALESDADGDGFVMMLVQPR